MTVLGRPRKIRFKMRDLSESKGNCWVNACSETLFGSLKVARLRNRHFKTRREAKNETVDWLLRCNPL